jgi:hypothetical protein
MTTTDRPLSAGDRRPAPATDRVLDDGSRANVWHATDSAIGAHGVPTRRVSQNARGGAGGEPSLNAGSAARPTLASLF